MHCSFLLTHTVSIHRLAFGNKDRSIYKFIMSRRMVSQLFTIKALSPGYATTLKHLKDSNVCMIAKNELILTTTVQQINPFIMFIQE